MADIKIISKQNGVAVVLPTGAVFIGDADGDYVAEPGSISTQLNIKRDIDTFYVAKNVVWTDIKNSAGVQIGTSRDNCVSLLNSLFFNRRSSIQEIDNVDFQNQQQAGQVLKLVDIGGGTLRISNEDEQDVVSEIVAATSISAGDKTTIQSNLGVDPSGTDNSTDVTLGGSYNYITISGQTITRNQVDYNTDISNTPSIPVSGVDFDPVGTDNSTDVTLSGSYNYLTLTGQQITLGQVDYSTDVSNTPSIPVSGVDFDPVGTDNSTDVTLAGAYNYLTLTGQQITLGQVDYSTDISNTPSIPVSGVDFDPVGTDNSTDATVGATASDVLKMAAGQVLGAFDAGVDKLVFWDDSESKLTYATIGTNLTMTGSTLSASGGGGGGGSANMENTFSAPSTVGAFQDGARLAIDAYGTAPSATAGTLVNFGNTAPSAVGAQSVNTAATGMLTVVTDAASGDELLVEGVIKMSSNTGWSTAKKGAPLYMSTTAGAVTTTAPSTAGEFVRVVGHVVDGANSTIYFKPDNTWLEL